MSNRPPTSGTIGGMHHKKESFKSGWSKAQLDLERRLYRGEIPVEQMVLLREWYNIRQEQYQNPDEQAAKKIFDEKRKQFFPKLPEEQKLFNAILIISSVFAGSIDPEVEKFFANGSDVAPTELPSVGMESESES